MFQQHMAPEFISCNKVAAVCMTVTLATQASAQVTVGGDVLLGHAFDLFGVQINTPMVPSTVTLSETFCRAVGIASFETFSTRVDLEDPATGISQFIATLTDIPPAADVEMVVIFAEGGSLPVEYDVWNTYGLASLYVLNDARQINVWRLDAQGQWIIDTQLSVPVGNSLGAGDLGGLQAAIMPTGHNGEWVQAILVDDVIWEPSTPSNVEDNTVAIALLESDTAEASSAWLGMSQDVASGSIGNGADPLLSPKNCGGKSLCPEGSEPCPGPNFKCKSDTNPCSMAGAAMLDTDHNIAGVDIQLPAIYEFRERLRESQEGRGWVNIYYQISVRMDFGLPQAVALLTSEAGATITGTVHRFLNGGIFDVVVPLGDAAKVRSLFNDPAFATRLAADSELDTLVDSFVAELEAIEGMQRWRLIRRYGLPEVSAFVPGDLNMSGVVDEADITAYIDAHTRADPISDFGAPYGEINFNDLIEFLAEFSEPQP